jgi:hypothetical protein
VLRIPCACTAGFLPRTTKVLAGVCFERDLEGDCRKMSTSGQLHDAMKLALRVPSMKRIAMLLVFAVPVMSWAIVKPVRVIAPELAGVVSCTAAPVCVDDTSKLTEASGLYSEANAFVAARFGVFLHQPRVVFCSTQACADAFGLGARSAVTVGTIGTVIGPRAWKPFYVRHELIHQLQGQQYGVVKTLLKPVWLIEGMAYALSEDPRAVLAEPWQGYRTRFDAWHDKVGDAGLWTNAPGI